MRLFIIGRLYVGDKLVAYKVYDSNAKKTGIYTKEAVRAQVRRGIRVVGLTVTGTGKVSGVHSSFNITKTDKLNGKGHPIEPSNRYILVAYSGFLEETEHRLVNSNGFERLVNSVEFEALVEEDKINGAIKSTKIKDKIVIYGPCSTREYWVEEKLNSSK